MQDIIETKAAAQETTTYLYSTRKSLSFNVKASRTISGMRAALKYFRYKGLTSSSRCTIRVNVHSASVLPFSPAPWHPDRKAVHGRHFQVVNALKNIDNRIS